MDDSRPTLQTVARIAGVSTATVSKVLNEREGIAKPTRQRVLDAIDRTGYTRTTEAPFSRRPFIVAASEGFASIYSAIVIDGMAAATSGLDVDLVVKLLPASEQKSSAENAAAWLREMTGGSGLVLVAATLPEALIDAAEHAHIPIVMIDPIGTSDNRVVAIGATNWHGGRTATEHLIDAGHRRIAWIGGVPGSIPSMERHLGFVSAMQHAEIPIDDRLVSNGDFSFSTGRHQARELLSLPERPSAFVCGNDHIALGVVQAARELGISVPHELSIIGFDDIPQAAESSPKLTTIHQPLSGMGAMAVETALNMSRGAAPASSHIQLATSLVIRETTAPPPV